MKKTIAIIGLFAVLLLTLAGPALAASLGVSPSSVDLEIEGTNSITTSLQAHYYTGEIEISLIGIPLRIEPRFITVDASEDPVTVEVTIYGDHCLETQVHEGFIRFTGITGGTVAMAVQVRATITNIADGIEPVVETSVEPIDEVDTIEEEPEESIPEESQPEEGVAEQPSEEVQQIIQPTGESEQASATPSESSSFPVLPVAGIAAGTIIIITLIVVIARRYQY